MLQCFAAKAYDQNIGSASQGGSPEEPFAHTRCDRMFQAELKAREHGRKQVEDACMTTIRTIALKRHRPSPLIVTTLRWVSGFVL